MIALGDLCLDNIHRMIARLMNVLRNAEVRSTFSVTTNGFVYLRISQNGGIVDRCGLADKLGVAGHGIFQRQSLGQGRGDAPTSQSLLSL